MLLFMVAGGSRSYEPSLLKWSLLKFREFIGIGPIFVALLFTMSKKSPPKFKDGTSYTSWRNKIGMWALVTSTPKPLQFYWRL